MPKTKYESGTKIVYYAEGAPYSGPHPAFIERVHPVDKDDKAAPLRVDLKVYFNGLENTAHTKTNVPYSLEPQKHHWGDIPADWPWPEPKADEVAGGAPAAAETSVK